MSINPINQYPCQAPNCTEVSSRERKFKMCGGCRTARYCSKDHQKADWLSHKLFCQQVEQVTIQNRETKRHVIFRVYPDEGPKLKDKDALIRNRDDAKTQVASLGEKVSCVQDHYHYFPIFCPFPKGEIPEENLEQKLKKMNKKFSC